MTAILFVGVQASGKSTFFQQRFADTHVRINLDMLRTRNREERLIQTCIDIEQPFVVDNTNVTKAERHRYIQLLTERHIKISGYYFKSRIEICKARNAVRPEDKRVPIVGILGTYARLELPSYDEGFDDLFYVSQDGDGAFLVEEWRA